MIDFTERLMAELTDYSDNLIKSSKDIISEEAKALATKIKSSSPRSGKAGKRYADGWKAEKTSADNFSAEYVVYNRKKPSLTHLLENGHLNKDGSRTEGINHIDNNADDAIKRVIERINGEV